MHFLSVFTEERLIFTGKEKKNPNTAEGLKLVHTPPSKNLANAQHFKVKEDLASSFSET